MQRCSISITLTANNHSQIGTHSEVLTLFAKTDQLYAGYMRLAAILISLSVIAGLLAGSSPQLGLLGYWYEQISKGYYQQGKQLYQQNRLQEAEACLTKAIDLCPFAPLPIHYLALVQHAQGRYVDACYNYGRCINYDPQCASAYHNRSFIRELWGDDVGALSDSITAVSLEPDNFAFLSRR